MSSNRIYLSPPHMDGHERDLLLDAFDSNWIAPLGPHVNTFESEFAEKVQVQHAAALSSGTAALHLALEILGIGPRDDGSNAEVLTSSFTFAATANAITYAGATPVFIDSDLHTWNMDPNLLADELADCDRHGKLPQAVVVVDVNGQCADYDSITEICQRYEIPIIEDAAEALGASYRGKAAGGFGKIGCFSFNGNKIITTSGGGMLVTDNQAWAKKARFLATQARDPAVHYQHSHIGYNYRMSNLLAAVGRGQLQVLDDRVAKRRRNFKYYKDHLQDLPGWSFMPEPDGWYSTNWLTGVLIDSNEFGASYEDVRQSLESHNIESRPLWKPMHMQPVFADCRRRGGEVSEKLFDQGLCLPSGSSLSENDLARIVQIIRNVAKK